MEEVAIKPTYLIISFYIIIIPLGYSLASRVINTITCKDDDFRNTYFYILCYYTVYDETFEGENFRGFLQNANLLPLNHCFTIKYDCVGARQP